MAHRQSQISDLLGQGPAGRAEPCSAGWRRSSCAPRTAPTGHPQWAWHTCSAGSAAAPPAAGRTLAIRQHQMGTYFVEVPQQSRQCAACTRHEQPEAPCHSSPNTNQAAGTLSMSSRVPGACVCTCLQQPLCVLGGAIALAKGGESAAVVVQGALSSPHGPVHHQVQGTLGACTGGQSHLSNGKEPGMVSRHVLQGAPCSRCTSPNACPVANTL